MTDHDLRVRTAWRAAVISVVLNLVGMPLELVVLRTVPGVLIWPAIGALAWSAVLLVFLVTTRRRQSRMAANSAFVLNTAVIVSALWMIGQDVIASGRTWMPFQEFKLGMVTVAMIAPEPWLGVVGIAAYATASLAQFEAITAVSHDHLVVTEPWATLAFGLFSVILLAYRLRQSVLERGIAFARARNEATEELAKVMLAVRDLSNTPLQTIAFAAETARTLHPDLAPVIDRIDRSLGKLRALDRRLRAHEHTVRWTPREESFNQLPVGAATKPS
jgi:hypothetical protein